MTTLTLNTLPSLTIPPLDAAAIKAAQARQNQLTKPPGSLGKLETLAIWLAGCQATSQPSINRPHITIFAADHGVTEAGVSAFPAVVTQEMVKNFSRGGAAITVIARAENAHFEVVDVGMFESVGERTHLVIDRVGAGTANFLKTPAMTEAELEAALNVGRRAVERTLANQADLFIGGEMGIGNTTAATALICQQTGISPSQAIGAGTGLTAEQLPHKQQVIEQALAKHQQAMHTPMQALQHLGGFEIAALTGAYLTAAQHGLPILIDGVISSAAALIAVQTCPDSLAWMQFAHQSVEPAQQAVFKALGVEPLLDLGMRLGEGSGAAMALPIVKLACQLHNQMATFEEASVSTADEQAISSAHANHA